MQRFTLTLNLLVFLFLGALLGALLPFYARLFGANFVSDLQFVLFWSSSFVIGIGLGLLTFAINKLTLLGPVYNIARELKAMSDEEAGATDASLPASVLGGDQGQGRQRDALKELWYWFYNFVETLGEKIAKSSELAGALRENSVELNIELHRSADLLQSVSNNLGSIEKLSKDQGDLVHNTGEHVQNFTENYSKIAEDSGVLSDNFKDFSYYIQKQDSLTQDFFSSMESLQHSLGDQNSGKTNDPLNSDLLGITIQFAKESTSSIDEQVQRFTRVEKLLEEIEDIAESTHLLSINASIEAARAGDSGRGFTIVALQIRNLATNSGTLTSEIREQIEAIISMAKNSGARLADLRGILNSRMEDVITDMQSLTGCAKDITKTVGQVATIQRKLKDKVEDIDQEFGGTNEVRETLLHSMGQLSDYSEQLNQSVERIMTRSGQIAQVTQDFLSQGAMVERQSMELLESVNRCQKNNSSPTAAQPAEELKPYAEELQYTAQEEQLEEKQPKEELDRAVETNAILGTAEPETQSIELK